MAAQRVAVHVFRRDLRLEDNTALIQAAQECDAILPVFIFPDEQIDPAKNPFFSHAAVQFMCESLRALDAQIRKLSSGLLMIRAPDNTTAIRLLLDLLVKRSSASASVIRDPIRVYFNADDSAYARSRDERMAKVIRASGHTCVPVHGDYGLLPGDLLADETYAPDKILANFFKKVVVRHDIRPASPQTLALVKKKIRAFSRTLEFPDVQSCRVLDADTDLSSLYRPLRAPVFRGGRTPATLRRLASMVFSYADTRDVPALEEKSTTRTSAHLKFGTISVREAYATISDAIGPATDPATDPDDSKKYALLRELVFREFYRRIYAPRPELHMLKDAYKHEIDSGIPWKQPGDAPELWAAWTEGRTGLPIVDAGMRQLHLTGWTHNRVRMIVASVATRHMLFDWRICAQYYYTKLADADPMSNAAGWQWAAGVGVDSAPFFRRPLNPFLQSKKFDPDAAYIKTYVAELRGVDPRLIHAWHDAAVSKSYSKSYSYPEPVITIKETSARAHAMWRHAARAASPLLKTKTLPKPKKNKI
jgi:deoxyribodipyrimidine photo-lyase